MNKTTPNVTALAGRMDGDTQINSGPQSAMTNEFKFAVFSKGKNIFAAGGGNIAQLTLLSIS